MKKTVIAFFVIASLLLSGCNAWLNSSYASVVPHKEQNMQPEEPLEEPENYEDIVLILTNMIQYGQQKQTISMKEMENGWEEYVDEVVEYVQKVYPLGAYAVSKIDYEIGTSFGRSALAVEIVYHRSLAEIDAVQNAETPKQFADILYHALRTMKARVTVCVENYTETDFTQLVRDYAMRYPQYVMEEPRISATMYPQSGKDRVVELFFTYDTSRDALLRMQEQVSLVFSSSELYVSGESTTIEKYGQLYFFLMINRHDYSVQTSITPAYSLLHHGVGDSKAVATVYAAMCRQAGLNCETISGTRAGQAWHWNIIKVNGRTYHVDLLRCHEQGRFFYNTAGGMTDYVWDYSAY